MYRMWRIENLELNLMIPKTLLPPLHIIDTSKFSSQFSAFVATPDFELFRLLVFSSGYGCPLDHGSPPPLSVHNGLLM